MDSLNKTKVYKNLFILILIFFIFAAPAAQAADPLEVLEERERAVGAMMEAATVFVLCEDDDGYGFATGFVVADGYVLTNGHVVAGVKNITILSSKIKPTRAVVVKTSYKRGAEPGADDFALLKFSPSAKLPVLTFNTQVNRMDRVSAWGFPGSVTQYDKSLTEVLNGNMSKTPPVVYTEGTVSSIVTYDRRTNIIHTAQIARGNSGGPLINKRGEVVGINTWGDFEAEDGLLNAALPADRIVTFIYSAGVTPQVIRGAGQIPAAPSRPQPTVAPSAAPVQAQKLKGDAASILESAKKGNLDAQLFAGVSYYDGSDGFPLNMALAVRWLEAAVKQKSPEASAMLGSIYVSEEEYLNPKKAIPLLKAGASAGPEIPALLAILYYDGESMGIARDVDECFKWASKAAQLGDADGKAYLATLYYYGEGVDEDKKRALKLATEASKGDSTSGKAILAWIYYYGEVVKENLSYALELALAAGEEGDASAQGLLASMYYYGNGVKQSFAKAEVWGRRAADQANEFGQYIMGCLYYEGKAVKKDLPTAWAYFDMAAEKYVEDAEEKRDEVSKKMSSAQKQRAKEIKAAWRKEWNL